MPGADRVASPCSAPLAATVSPLSPSPVGREGLEYRYMPCAEDGGGGTKGAEVMMTMAESVQEEEEEAVVVHVSAGRFHSLALAVFH